ncbi:hypothetical protein EN788_57795, partial [Mesorhizobium sp. M2D.F.Ca.ET.145.01.1.1]
KILSGVMPPSSGRITFDGADYQPASPQDAKRLGIVTIYQELSLIPRRSSSALPGSWTRKRR